MNKLNFEKFQVAKLSDSQKNQLLGGTDADDPKKSKNGGPVCGVSSLCQTDDTAGNG